MHTASERRYPIGAELIAGTGVHFRVWAPAKQEVRLLVSNQSEGNFDPVDRLEMLPEEGGYFSLLVPGLQAGVRYLFELGGKGFPDPASRFQPQGPHGPSQVIDDRAYEWRHTGWQGLPERNLVVYEMHIGTFTPGGTWEAALEQLPRLRDLGVNVLELMPVAEFLGDFGWGYDGVDLFAPTRLYGRPDDFRRFVDEAHASGLSVILDVVYNHLGPDGNYLREFTPDYFTDRYANEWGQAINFDGENCSGVREFFLANAAYWIDVYHLDGLRLDATQQIFDASPNHIVAAIARRARQAAGERRIFLVGENETQSTWLLRGHEEGGAGLDALWNDDFHHTANVRLRGKREAYYTDYRGSPQEFVSAARHGFLYQGQWYAWQKKRRGTGTRGLEPRRFVTFLENHDQVSNSLRGQRLAQASHPGMFRAMTALFLLMPGTPMLFQGQEFASSAPFLYFAHHSPELAELVRKGRGDFVKQFPTVLAGSTDYELDLPHARATFERCILKPAEIEAHQAILQLHKDLLGLRAAEFEFLGGAVEGAVLSDTAFVLRYDAGPESRLLVVNFGPDLQLGVVPEPLLAPPEDREWEVAWSSERPVYGGSGAAPLNEAQWHLQGYAAVWLSTRELRPQSEGGEQRQGQP